MEISKKDNRIFPNFSLRTGAVMFFSLTALLGAIAAVFSDVPIAAAIATPVLAAVVIAAVREPLSVCGILIPAVLTFSVTGSFSASALWLGLSVCTASSAYLFLGRKYIAPLSAAVIAYTAAALIINPIAALAALIPFVLGITAGFMLPRFELTATVTVMSTLAAAILFCAFTANGGSLAEIAEELRTEIALLYTETEQEMIIISEDVAQKMAAMIVNLLPGGFFATISAFCYISCSAVISILRVAGLGKDLPESMTRLTLTPVSGIVYMLCFVCSLIFGSMTGRLEMVAAVSDNVILCISPAFLVIGCRFARDYVAARIFRTSYRKERLASICIAVSFLMLPSLAAAGYIGIGVGYTLIPIYRHLFNKIKSYIQK